MDEAAVDLGELAMELHRKERMYRKDSREVVEVERLVVSTHESGGARSSGRSRRRDTTLRGSVSSRYARIFSITTGSSMLAITFTAPPHTKRPAPVTWK